MNKKIFNSTLDKPEYALFALMLIFPIITLFFSVWAAIVQFILVAVFTVFRVIAKRKHSDRLYSYLQSITLYLDEASKENLTRFPMPVTLLEALSVGCIPICSPVGGIVNVVKHGVNGLLSKDSTEEEYYLTVKKR